MKSKTLIKQTLGHFFTDAACALVIFSATHDIKQAFIYFIAYNFLAFCLQPVAGFVLDKFQKIKPSHYITTAFILLIIGFVPFLPAWEKVIFIGIGNCLFHTGAGTIILNSSKKKMAPLGIFVSSGALGLTLGTLLSPYAQVHNVCMMALLILEIFNLTATEEKITKKSGSIHWKIAPLLCLCIVIRSFMGFISVTTFVKSAPIILMITCGVVAGKALGGLLCDKWGIRRVATFSTLIVVALFLFSFHNPYLWTMVQLIVNLSMPITLYLIYESMPHLPAFSFGLAASFLCVGYWAALPVRGLSVHPACLLILFIANLGIILYSERKLR